MKQTHNVAKFNFDRALEAAVEEAGNDPVKLNIIIETVTRRSNIFPIWVLESMAKQLKGESK